MSLEQTIRDTLISESMDMDARLQQLVRAGLMPQNTLPLLRKSIAKVQMGLSLQGPERDVMATFINSMMYIVLGDDTIFNKARAGAKSYAAEETEVEEAVGDYTVKKVSPADAWKKHTGQKTSKSKVPVDPKTGKTLYQKVTSEEVEELDETAKVVAHLQKRYGDNIRKSHVRSAANDFGVGYVALSHAVRKKLGKKMLDEELHYTVHKAAAGWHVNQHSVNGVWHHSVQTGYHDTKEKAVAWAKKHAGSRPHKIEIKEEQIEEGEGIVTPKQKYFGEPPKGTFAYERKYGKYTAKGTLRKRPNPNKPPVQEEVEELDELSVVGLDKYHSKAYQSMFDKDSDKKTVAKRKKGMDMAYNKAGFGKAKVYASEEAEQIDELSKATMGRYINKAATKIGSQGVTAGLKIAADEKSSKNFKDMGKREKGIARAVGKLTKESRKTDALADIAAIKQMNESYKTTFDAALEQYGIKSPSELDEEKRKEFFNFVDQNYKKGDN